MKVVDLTGLRPHVMAMCYSSRSPDTTPEVFFARTLYENPLAADVYSQRLIRAIIKKNVIPEMQTLWTFIEARLEE